MSLNEVFDLSSSGKRLSYLRKLLNLTRSEFSQKYDLQESSLSCWETDRNGGITSFNAEKITDAVAPLVKCSPNWLLKGEGKKPARDEEII